MAPEGQPVRGGTGWGGPGEQPGDLAVAAGSVMVGLVPEDANLSLHVPDAFVGIVVGSLTQVHTLSLAAFVGC